MWTLKCFQRNGGYNSPPGLIFGLNEIKNNDYCYDPDWKGLMPAALMWFQCTDSVHKENCGVGQGPCSVDKDCHNAYYSNLKCFQRDASQSVPGVRGVEGVFSSTDGVCYDPNWTGLMPIYEWIGVGCTSSLKCGIGQGPCTNDSDCLSGLQCSTLGAKDVPGIDYGGVMNTTVCFDPLMPTYSEFY